MKRRGFLAAFAALPFVPFAPKGAFAEGGRITSAMFKVGSAGPELEISPRYPSATQKAEGVDELAAIRAEISEMRGSASQ